MTWQLDGSGGNFWMIRTETGELVAIIRHCDLPTARLLCAALEMQGELATVEWAAVDEWGAYCPSCHNYKHEGHTPSCGIQRALRLAAGDME